MENEKRILIIAGPNGAGKTVFATEFLPNEADCPVFINADLIAAGMSPFRPHMAAVGAGRLMLKLMHDYVRQGESFAFETTLSGRGYVRSIHNWREQGYHVQLIFLRLRTPEMAIERVKQRVLEGGHDVPEDVIRRRLEAGWHNIRTIYSDLVDGWKLYENSSGTPLLLREGEKR